MMSKHKDPKIVMRYDHGRENLDRPSRRQHRYVHLGQTQVGFETTDLDRPRHSRAPQPLDSAADVVYDSAGRVLSCSTHLNTLFVCRGD
jgi:hypothetical protein